MEDVSYQQQGIEFLRSTGTTFTASYKDHAPYFIGEKESRDIYYITLKNSRHRYRFTFGQSIANSGMAPSAYGVLAGITKSDPGTFEDFCGEFGYDRDSRNAEKIYNAVVKEWENVQKLFPEIELEQLREIN
jgi:hypothetical protein